jgi:hypothetical protein
MSPCFTSAASFALLAVAEKPTFPYRPRGLRPKSLFGKYGSTIHGASDGIDSQGVRRIGVDKQSNWRELGDSLRLFLFGTKKRKFDPFGEGLRVSSGSCWPAAMSSTVLGARNANRFRNAELSRLSIACRRGRNDQTDVNRSRRRLLVTYNSSPSSGADENTVGGASVTSFGQAPMTKRTTSLSLDWGANGQADQIAIADVLSYDGSKPTIAAPDGWQLIRDDYTRIPLVELAPI